MFKWSIVIESKKQKHYCLTESETLDNAVKKCLDFLGLNWQGTSKSGMRYDSITELKYHLGFKAELAITI